jgi:hypothetical protein
MRLLFLPSKSIAAHEGSDHCFSGVQIKITDQDEDFWGEYISRLFYLKLSLLCTLIALLELCLAIVSEGSPAVCPKSYETMERRGQKRIGAVSLHLKLDSEGALGALTFFLFTETRPRRARGGES